MRADLALAQLKNSRDVIAAAEVERARLSSRRLLDDFLTIGGDNVEKITNQPSEKLSSVSDG